MRFLLLALIAVMPATSAAAAAAVAVQTVPPARGFTAPTLDNCKQAGAHYYAYRDGKRLKPQNLTELPPANAYIAIVRNDGICEVPVIVRYNMGGR